MSERGTFDKREREKLKEFTRNQSLSKAMSDRARKKDERFVVKGKCSSETIPQVITYLLMKQKFDQIYKRIQKISIKDESCITRFNRQPSQKYIEQHEPNLKLVNFAYKDDNNLSPEANRLKTSHLRQKKSLPCQADESLEINTVSEPQVIFRGKSASPVIQLHLRKSRYRKKLLQPIVKEKMSNNIKDYLSVEKISLKQMQQSMYANKLKILKNHNQSNLLAYQNPEVDLDNMNTYNSQVIQSSPVHYRKNENLTTRKPSKFKIPFQLYYYRDFIWKIAYSNEMIIEPAEEYQFKIKYYVGGGNNSNLIKGIMKRRPWFILTDKLQDAQFVWTQIKTPAYYNLQKNGEHISVISEQEIAKLRQKSLKRIVSKQDKASSLFNQVQLQIWSQYWKKHMQKQRTIKQNLRIRTKIFNLPNSSISSKNNLFKIHNHFCNNFIIGNKKALFKTMSQFYGSRSQNVFDYLPLTFHIKDGLQDDEYLNFLQNFYAIAKSNKSDAQSIHKFNAWIVKPGENSNRGNGIIVCLDLSDIKTILKKKQKHDDGTNKTYILQKYIERPLLYKKRKFDLRHYIMLNCSNGRMKGYWYRQGYVRTTSSQYTLKISSGSVHLTNDAVQKHLPDYGKYQKGNKISYEELDSYMKKMNSNFDFWSDIYPKMKKVATDSIHASARNIDPNHRMNNFQIFGLDFMIDANFNVWLIEINTNPCLQTTCPVLNKIIPRFIQNTFQICIDPIYPAPLNFKPRYEDYFKNMSEQNNFELVFDERIDGAASIGESMLSAELQQQDDIFDDDGQDFNDQHM